MKKTLISASVASVLTLASFGALAEGPNFYGRLDLSVTNSDTGLTSRENKEGTVLENNFSHVGVKGSETIAKGFDIIYQMEFQVENTSSNSDVFKARNTYLGLKTNAGTVLVGRNDSVFKQAEGGIDLFGNSNADIDRLVGAQSRVADGIWYYSPKIADLVTLNATYLMTDNNQAGVEDADDQYALSTTIGDKKLKAQNFYVAGAYNKGIAGMDAYRGVAQVKLAGFKLGGLFQNSESISKPNLEGNTYFVNVSYNLNGVNLKAEYGKDEAGLGLYAKRSGIQTTETTDVNITSIIVGADYKVAKSTMVYGHYAMYEGDYKLSGMKIDLEDDNVLTVGVRYNF
ncbi:porin [Shewanella benthica]|uniref:porin n=1 Tax=Shewanella benthica TaxID=43661 RepID=UPI00187A0EF3|nr:porin [Shewanella benthica]MBE7215017.1 porin [Shewanella benthica]MCL1061991.1 porin [Shewanella benthica]